MNNRELPLFLIPLMAANITLPVAAQDNTAPSIRSIDEIVITARKREESILKVPVVATALSGETLETFQLTDLYAVANRVPGFVMGQGVGTVGIQTSLRGIGPSSQTSTVDQSVSLSIDGLPLTQGYAFTAGMFDVAQVEVLKGPQALFYGKNSTAGVISMRSTDPTEEKELIVRGGHEFEAHGNTGELILSGPVSDDLKLRLAARFSETNGYFENTASPVPGLGGVKPKYRDFAPKESWILRTTALFDSSDNYQARVKIGYVDERTDGSGGNGQIVACPDGTGGVPPFFLPFMNDADCRQDERTQLGDFDPQFWPGIRNNGVPFIDTNQLFGTVEQNFAFTPELTLTSVTGYYDIKQDNLVRGSATTTNAIAADFTFYNDQITQELRLTSDYTDRSINFMVGGFYQDGEITVFNRLSGNTAIGFPALLQSGKHEIGIESKSLFGQLLWQSTEHIEIAVGARWTDEDRKHRFFNNLTGGNEVALAVPELNASNLSPEVSVTYTPTDDLTYFAAYRRGFKSGSFNTVTSLTSTDRPDFGDEEAQGGELGIKTVLLDGRGSLNVAAYLYDYSDLQVGASEINGETGALLLRTINAASAEVKGIEAEFTFTPDRLENLAFYGAINYNHARFDDFDNANCGNGQTIAEGCNRLFNPGTGLYSAQDLSGEPLPKAPEWTGNFGLDYVLPMTAGLELTVGSNVNYSSDYYTNLENNPDTNQDSYYKLSAYATLSGQDDGWEISLIGNNLNDELTAGSCSNSNFQNAVVLGGQFSGGTSRGPAGEPELLCFTERGREIQMRVGFRF